jgi:hypothetical protein
VGGKELSEIVQLAPKPTVHDELRQDVVEILRKCLAEAERGEVMSVLVIMKRQDKIWCDERSGVWEFSDAIGKLEIVKQNWIRAYSDGCCS